MSNVVSQLHSVPHPSWSPRWPKVSRLLAQACPRQQHSNYWCSPKYFTTPATRAAKRVPTLIRVHPQGCSGWLPINLTFLLDNICPVSYIGNDVLFIITFYSYLYLQSPFAMAMSLGESQCRVGSVWIQGRYSLWRVCQSDSGIAVVTVIERN